MSELHGARGGKVLEFDLLRPHEEARLRCKSCGNVARHVWPQKTPMASLECGVCGLAGRLDYDLPEAPPCVCGHDYSHHVQMRLTGTNHTSQTCEVCYAANPVDFCTYYTPLIAFGSGPLVEMNPE